MKPKDQWATGTVQDRFDVSKLDQWLNTFLYADSLGIHLHFKLQETEKYARLKLEHRRRERSTPW